MSKTGMLLTYQNNFKKMTPLYLNPNLFFLLECGRVLVWDYEKHTQYLLEDPYFSELSHISEHGYAKDEALSEELKAAGLIDEIQKTIDWGWDVLSKIYHIGTKNVLMESADLNDEQYGLGYLEECAAIKEKIPDFYLEKTGKKITLPAPDINLLDNVSLWSVLKNRKTSRCFYQKSISLVELSTILYSVFGFIHGNWEELSALNLRQTGIRKSSPASGGIHAEEAYVCIYNIDDIEPGIYHYGQKNNELTLIQPGNYETEVIKINYQQAFSQGLAFGIYVTTRFDRSWWKYRHSRAYRMLQLDVGHVSQTFLLVCTALGLQTWLTGAFVDKEAEELLKINADEEAVILFLGAGKGSSEAIPKKWM